MFYVLLLVESKAADQRGCANLLLNLPCGQRTKGSAGLSINTLRQSNHYAGASDSNSTTSNTLGLRSRRGAVNLLASSFNLFYPLWQKGLLGLILCHQGLGVVTH
jgi:hypothetical protein